MWGASFICSWSAGICEVASKKLAQGRQAHGRRYAMMWGKRVLWKAERESRGRQGLWLGLGEIGNQEWWVPCDKGSWRVAPQSAVWQAVRETRASTPGFRLHNTLRLWPRDGSRQETGPERGRRGKRVCRGVGREGEPACQGLTMHRLCQENSPTGQGYF